MAVPSLLLPSWYPCPRILLISPNSPNVSLLSKCLIVPSTHPCSHNVQNVLYQIQSSIVKNTKQVSCYPEQMGLHDQPSGKPSPGTWHGVWLVHIQANIQPLWKLEFCSTI